MIKKIFVQIFFYIFIFFIISVPTLAAESYNISTYGSGAYGQAVCGDSVCDASESCSSCSSDCGACASTSSGGGGGGVFARFFSQENISTHIWNRIEAGSTATMKINKKAISFTQLDITVKNTLLAVEIKVEALAESPAESITRTYQYLSIEKTNIEDSDIGKVIIKFDVDEDWLKNNNADKNDIVLKIFRNNEWIDLPTKLIPKNNLVDIILNYVSYESESATLSYFAIGVKTDVKFEEKALEEVEVIEEAEEVTEELPPTIVEAPKPLEKPSKVPIAWLIAAAVAIFAIILILVYQRKKPAEHKEKTKGKKINFESIPKSELRHLESYIKNALDRGFSKRRIKKELLKSGWPKDVVEKEFEKI